MMLCLYSQGSRQEKLLGRTGAPNISQDNVLSASLSVCWCVCVQRGALAELNTDTYALYLCTGVCVALQLLSQNASLRWDFYIPLI